MIGKRILTMLGEITKDKVNASFVPLSSISNTSQSRLKAKWDILKDILSLTVAVWI